MKDIAHQRAELEANEARIAHERSLLRTLIDNVPDYIYVKDRDHRFLVANGELARRMGAESADALLGKSDFDFYPRDVATSYAAAEDDVLRSGKSLFLLEAATRTGYSGRSFALRCLILERPSSSCQYLL
jgi:PAS domain-containing protein